MVCYKTRKTGSSSTVYSVPTFSNPVYVETGASNPGYELASTDTANLYGMVAPILPSDRDARHYDYLDVADTREAHEYLHPVPIGGIEDNAGDDSTT